MTIGIRFPFAQTAATLLVAMLIACGSDSTNTGNGIDASVIGADATVGADVDPAADGASSDVASPPADASLTVPCTTSAECRGGEICTDNVCREVCSQDADCDGPLAACDIDAGLCVACTESSDCRGGEICEDQSCVRVAGETCGLLDERCDGNTRYFCEGDELQNEDCPEDSYCLPADAQSPTCQPQVCEPDALGCDGDAATVCNSSGSALTTLACGPRQTCDAGLCVARPCTAGSLTCDGSISILCSDDREEIETNCEDCSSSDFGCNCLDGVCEPRACEPGASRCAATGTQTCREDGSGYGPINACGAGQSCRSGTCLDDSCEAGDDVCIDGDAWTCSDDAEFVLSDDCSSSELCVDGECETLLCTPRAVVCVGQQQRTCSADGLSESITNCAATNRFCNSTTGRCADRLCTPSSAATCDGNNVVQCNAVGSGFDIGQECGATGCTAGACNDPCTGRTDLLGCQFYTADFEQLPGGCSGTCTSGSCVAGVCVGATGRIPVALVVYNPNTRPTDVRVRYGPDTLVSTVRVEQSSYVRFDLPSRNDIAGTQRSNRQYSISTDLPVAIWHEGPSTAGETTASNDMTRLFPVSAFGTEYVGVGYPADTNRQRPFRPAETLVMSQTGALVSVTTSNSAGIAAGGGVAELSAGFTVGVVMDDNQLFSATPSSSTGDLSGARFSSSTPFGLFSSYGCANVPTGIYFCDHLLEQIPPINIAAGTAFVVAKSANRGTEDDVIRITATASNGSTTVTTTAYRVGSPGASVVLNPGETFELLANRSFQLTATRPVMVHQYLVSGEYPSGTATCIPSSRVGCAIPDSCSGAGIGDPSMAIVIPTAHWSPSHYIYIPDAYPNANVTVSIPTDTVVRVDGTTSGAARTRLTGADVMQIPIGPGVHRLTAAVPFGALVTSHVCRSSIAYTGEFR
jgi:hypothetical protein